MPGFDATSNGLAQLASLAHIITFGSIGAERVPPELHAQRQRRGPAQRRRRAHAYRRRDFTAAIVALKPSTEGIENVAFNDFTMGVDTTALVQAENIYQVSDAFSRILGKHGLKFGGEIHAEPDQYASRRRLQRQLRLQRL